MLNILQYTEEHLLMAMPDYATDIDQRAPETAGCYEEHKTQMLLQLLSLLNQSQTLKQDGYNLSENISPFDANGHSGNAETEKDPLYCNHLLKILKFQNENLVLKGKLQSALVLLILLMQSRNTTNKPHNTDMQSEAAQMFESEYLLNFILDSLRQLGINYRIEDGSEIKLNEQKTTVNIANNCDKSHYTYVADNPFEMQPFLDQHCSLDTESIRARSKSYFEAECCKPKIALPLHYGISRNNYNVLERIVNDLTNLELQHEIFDNKSPFVHALLHNISVYKQFEDTNPFKSDIMADIASIMESAKENILGNKNVLKLDSHKKQQMNKKYPSVQNEKQEYFVNGIGKIASHVVHEQKSKRNTVSHCVVKHQKKKPKKCSMSKLNKSKKCLLRRRSGVLPYSIQNEAFNGNAEKKDIAVQAFSLPCHASCTTSQTFPQYEKLLDTSCKKSKHFLFANKIVSQTVTSHNMPTSLTFEEEPLSLLTYPENAKQISMQSLLLNTLSKEDEGYIKCPATSILLYSPKMLDNVCSKDTVNFNQMTPMSIYSQIPQEKNTTSFRKQLVEFLLSDKQFFCNLAHNNDLMEHHQNAEIDNNGISSSEDLVENGLLSGDENSNLKELAGTSSTGQPFRVYTAALMRKVLYIFYYEHTAWVSVDEFFNHFTEFKTRSKILHALRVINFNIPLKKIKRSQQEHIFLQLDRTMLKASRNARNQVESIFLMPLLSGMKVLTKLMITEPSDVNIAKNGNLSARESVINELSAVIDEYGMILQNLQQKCNGSQVG